jgi:hypothetical protein
MVAFLPAIDTPVSGLNSGVLQLGNLAHKITLCLRYALRGEMASTRARATVRMQTRR